MTEDPDLSPDLQSELRRKLEISIGAMDEELRALILEGIQLDEKCLALLAAFERYRQATESKDE